MRNVEFTEIGAIYRPRNGNAIRYRLANGIYYHETTDHAVINALESARSCQQRIRIHYGDLKTGQDWLEEHDVEGCIGNSMGPLKVPILVHNHRSSGGGALLDHCIVKIRWTTGGVLYQHPRYHAGIFVIREIGPQDALRVSGYTHAVDVDGRAHAHFRSFAAARRYMHKMTG